MFSNSMGSSILTAYRLIPSRRVLIIRPRLTARRCAWQLPCGWCRQSIWTWCRSMTTVESNLWV